MTRTQAQQDAYDRFMGTAATVREQAERKAAEVAQAVADSNSGPTYSTAREVLVIGGISTEGTAYAIRIPFNRFERRSRAMFLQLARGIKTGPVSVSLDYVRESDR